jgi:Spy/CpxP family protein refolding chaperone
MKKIIRSFAIVALMVSAFAFGANAQTQHGRAKLKAILTTEQLATFKENHKKHKAAADAFKATLTAEQKAVLADKALPRKERKAKLAAILTPAQKEVLDANKAQNRADRKAFMATLTDAQKVQMKEIFKGRHAKGDLKRNKTSKA